ncbi:hypothetical protein WM34_29520 [Burkholderia ubonensis]|uniref:hypothetical protein n=1 Tax=Burkholderia ubonensis TaxID=101571 RepID=UPI00075F4671|nr:hypothetical protein [Burkholderia ubonensis]KWD09670.1 hypothetical protein WL59_03480 [Burkholderia ubonensis]KWD13266.1 hypothetical protein WL60_17440 [Burkholderia ubonensis]KWQ01058.1 hypothetical protein WM34_29520 [Burkholderia ubonensis]
MNFPVLLSRGQCVAVAVGAATIGAIAAGAIAYFGGYRAGALAGDAKVEKLERQYADAGRVAVEQARAKEHAEAQRAADLAGDLFAEKARHALESNELKRRIASVTSQYRPAPDAPLQDLPRCVFTGGFVRLWNAAAGPDGVPAPGAAAGAAAPAGTDDALDSGVRQDDVLAHHIDTARHSRDIESQLNKLIDLVEGDAR